MRLIGAEEDVDRRLIAELEAQPPELAIITRDWSEPHTDDAATETLGKTLRRRGTVVHMVCALGNEPRRTRLQALAVEERRKRSDPLAGPVPHSSAVEKRLGDALLARGHAPVAQQRVGPFFLDWGLTKGKRSTQTRLDIEVDGRLGHEILPGRREPRDDRRDRIVELLGWRPIRFWAEDVDEDIDRVVGDIEQALREDDERGGRS